MIDASSRGREASRRALPPALRGIRAAFTFLTRLPLGGYPYRDEDFRWASAHFPLVGFVVGGAAALVFIAARGLGSFVAASLCFAAAMLITGAFHEDGLADTLDATGGAVTPERVLEILKDSRIGTYGGAALIMSLVLRISTLAELGAPVAVVLAAGVARLGPVWLLAAMPYVTGAGAKSSSVAYAGKRQTLVATFWVLGALAAVAAFRLVSLVACALALGVALGSTLLMGRWFHRRIGGITGDFLGATEQVGEVLVLLTLLAAEKVCI